MTSLYQDTIVAPATIPGTGAISIIRVSGTKAFSIIDSIVQLSHGTISEAEAYTIHYGSVLLNGTLLDQVLVSVFRAPHSYTGEDSVEISTHASSYIVQELTGLLLAAGARMAEPGEFTRRAFLNGKMDLAQAEAVADVISSINAASHRVAMNQLKGSFSAQLDKLRDQLLEMASLLELELDFSEEDVEFAQRDKLLDLVQKCLSHVERLAASFHQGNMIKNGVPVALVGAVNAGKSSLLNALLGEDRAIVSNVAGTTRDTIEEILQIEGLAFRFIDTAGIRESQDEIEQLGIERTYRKTQSAEVVLGVLDSSNALSELLPRAKQICGMVNPASQTLILLLNKADLLSKDDINKYVTTVNEFVSSIDSKAIIIPCSAKTGLGLETLKNALFQTQKELLTTDSGTLVTNLRHYQSLTSCAQALRRTAEALQAALPTDLVAEDLRAAIASVNLITGQDLGLSPEAVLHTIFSRHCIGK